MPIARIFQEAEPLQAAGGMPARTVVLALMVILPTIGTLVVLFGGLRLRALFKRIPRIQSRAHLDAYRSEHKLHSVLGALLKPLLGIANILFFVDLFLLGGPILDLLYSLVPSLVNIGVSLPFRALEQQVNDIPCATEELRKEWVEIKQE